jgi:hypothetical protein
MFPVTLPKYQSDGCREMAVGNTFGATVLSSYGGFWISVGIIFTPGGFQIIKSLEQADNGNPQMFFDSFGFMLFVSDPTDKFPASIKLTAFRGGLSSPR